MGPRLSSTLFREDPEFLCVLCASAVNKYVVPKEGLSGDFDLVFLEFAPDHEVEVAADLVGVGRVIDPDD